MLLDFYFAKFNFLRFISTPSNRSPLCVWFYLRYKIRNIIQSSVLSFPSVLKVVNFLLSFFSFSVFLLLLGRKPVVWIFSTNYAKFFCLFLWLCIMYCAALGNIARVYPWIVQGLTFYQHQYKNKILACVVQVDTFIISLNWLHLRCNGSWLLSSMCWFFK